MSSSNISEWKQIKLWTLCTAFLQFLRNVVHLAGRRRVPEMRQLDATECGAACLAMILNYYGRKTRISEVRERCGVGRDGLSALTIVNAARDYGLRVRAVSLQQNDFRHVNLPAIVHWEFAHFLVVERWSPTFVDVVDPAHGYRRLTAAEFDEGFTGVVIMLEPGVQFSRRSHVSQLSLWAYLRQMFRAPYVIVQILVSSLVLQVLGLAVPLFTKIFVDQVVPSGMDNVMMLMGIGMLVLVLTQLVTSFLRATLLIALQARIDAQMMLNFFEHLLLLPYRFFQQRLSGDLLARLGSNSIIRDIFTNQLTSVMLDGSFVSVYLLILLWQSRVFSLLALLVGLVQIILLVATTRPIRDLTRRELAAQGASQGYMNEALAGIATLKASGVEARALTHWSNLFFDQLNISMRRDYLATIVDSVLTALRTLTPLLLLWVGTMQVLAGSMSVGTMLALNSLVTAFLTPLSSLVNSGKRLQQVRAHFERITDVIEAKPEQDVQNVQQPPTLRGKIEVKNVSFQYDPHAEMVLRDINLCIEPGQKIALVGHTGSGKSTLGKLLLGLYLPTAGEILYDGLALQQLNYRAVRSQFGVVLQESFIFSGSVRENIAFNNPDLNMERVMQVAKMAAIHRDILQMPMQYNTFVSEAGSALSGGQRQRLAIARALAHSPALLLFDEATSHLDVITERIVEQNLRTLDCTRIIIAHRLSTIRDADLILVMDKGEIVERGTHDELMVLNGFYAKLVQRQMDHSREKTASMEVQYVPPLS